METTSLNSKLLKYLLWVLLDGLLLVIPFIVIVYLFGSGPVPAEPYWWLIGLCGVALLIIFARAAVVLADLWRALRDQRWGWSLGVVFRVALLVSAVYTNGLVLMILLGAGVSVAEPGG